MHSQLRSTAPTMSKDLLILSQSGRQCVEMVKFRFKTSTRGVQYTIRNWLLNVERAMTSLACFAKTIKSSPPYSKSYHFSYTLYFTIIFCKIFPRLKSYTKKHWKGRSSQEAATICWSVYIWLRVSTAMDKLTLNYWRRNYSLLRKNSAIFWDMSYHY